MSLSQIVEKNGRRLIGRQESEESGGLLGLENMTMCENFHSKEK